VSFDRRRGGAVTALREAGDLTGPVRAGLLDPHALVEAMTMDDRRGRALR
jgi:hypothetical protein